MKTNQHISHECPSCWGEGKVTSKNGDRQCRTCKGMGRILTHQMRKYKNI